MSLKDRIERELRDLKAMEEILEEARKELWQAEYIRKNDERHLGESEEHWQERKKRNRHRRNHREDVKNHLAKKVMWQKKRIEKLREKREEVQDQPPPSGGSGFATFDGKTVPAWMVQWLQKSRAAGWGGYVVSGVRTPAHSISLCIGMCGAPSCPGTCAGAASNHNMLPSQGYPYGALDVSDYANFEAIQFQDRKPTSELPAQRSCAFQHLRPLMFTIPTATVYEFKRSKKVKIGVWAIQRGLNSLGWEVVEDGVYGPKTKKAIETFQLSNFLLNDGVFGPKSSNALAADLGMNVGKGELPVGLLPGIVNGESGGLIAAVNWTVAGGVDCGYCQRRIWEGDYEDQDTITRAFDGEYQMKLLKNMLVERFVSFRPRAAVTTDELAWRLATLNHNYPYAATKIATVGVSGLSSYFSTPQTWVTNVGTTFADGAPVRTPLEWCQKYSLGSAAHNDPGLMTKLVTDWTV